MWMIPSRTVAAVFTSVGVLAVHAAPAVAIDILRDPSCGGGVCNVDNFDIFGAPVGTPLEVDVIFTDMQHIALAQSPSTTIEFGIGNTGNNFDLAYRFEFNLSDMNGNLITDDLLVVEDVAPAGVIHIPFQTVTQLPADTIFHDFHIMVETDCPAGAACNNFDLRVAGGAGDPGTAVSGPIRFNRAEKGIWVPEPSAALLLVCGLVAIAARRPLKKADS
jgi:hypothetical protein